MSRRGWLILGVLTGLFGLMLGLAAIAHYGQEINLWWKTPRGMVLLRLDVDFEGSGPGMLELGDGMDLFGKVPAPKVGQSTEFSWKVQR